MSYNGAGVWSANSTGLPVVTGTTISSTMFNAFTGDVATGLSTALLKDGTQTVTANIPFNSNRLTGVAAGTATTDAANLLQVQNGASTLLGTVAGTNTITATLTPAITAYASGQKFILTPAATNTAASTLNISSVGAKSIFKNGAALVGGELRISLPVFLEYDGTQFNILANSATTDTKATAVVSATTTDIWAISGDFVHITGTTTITGLGTAPYAGARREVIFDGALTLTHNATTLVLPGSANITTAANDRMIVRADTTANMVVIDYVRANGIQVFGTQSANAVLAGPPTGAAALPAFRALVAADIAGLGGLVQLNSGSVAAAATLDIVMTSYTAYRNKVLVLNLMPVTDAVDIWLRVSTDGGSTYDAGASAYAWNVNGSAAATAFDDGSVGDAKMRLEVNAAAANPIGNASTEGCNFTVFMYDTTNAARWPGFSWHGMHTASDASSRLVTSFGGGHRGAAQDTDAVRVMFSSGNISSGNWALYGFN